MGKREREYDPARTLRRMRNFVVAVLLAVLAWLLLSRAYAATRADNALDELYYSTLDSRSCEALWGKGHLSPTVLASALSAYRNDRPRICIEGACSLYGYQGKDALAPFDNNYVYLFGYQDVRSVSDGRMETLSWYIEDGGDRGHSEEYPQRCVVLRMGFSQEGLGDIPREEILPPSIDIAPPGSTTSIRRPSGSTACTVRRETRKTGAALLWGRSAKATTPNGSSGSTGPTPC